MVWLGDKEGHRLEAIESVLVEMAATHLRWDPIGGNHATGLPIKVTVQACTSEGEQD